MLADKLASDECAKSLETLTRLACNPECISSLVDGLVSSLTAVLDVAEYPDGTVSGFDRLVRCLLNQIVKVGHEINCRSKIIWCVYTSRGQTSWQHAWKHTQTERYKKRRWCTSRQSHRLFLAERCNLHCKVRPLAGFFTPWSLTQYVICLSVVRVYCNRTAEAKITRFSLQSSTMTQLSAWWAWRGNSEILLIDSQRKMVRLVLDFVALYLESVRDRA